MVQFLIERKLWKFPSDFIEKYKDLLGAEAEEFLYIFDQEAVSAYRINPLKSSRRTIPIPFLKHLRAITVKFQENPSDHATGLVYSQEPAAQMVASSGSSIKRKPCSRLSRSTRHGKSTHLLSYLITQVYSVSNEINFKRSKVLVENIERFGAKMLLWTNTSADKLAKVF